MDPVIFDSPTLRVACISDTHNDDCREHVPPADIFIHAGDFTDDGTLEELHAAFDWISALPHKVKIVVAGNHDLGLDHAHPAYLPEAVELFTSARALAHGIHYLDREVKTVALLRAADGGLRPVRVYGNPRQPDFLQSSYAFTYPPFPASGAEDAWTNAPARADAVDIWATHSPPKGRLDTIPVPPLTGCAVLARRVAQARPLLCVFGHYHSSWGIERVRWRPGCDGVGELLPVRAERGHEFDFSGRGGLARVERGSETVFVNAAWMTLEKRKVERRNPVFTVTLPLATWAV